MLKDRLSEDLRNAMRARDEARLRTVRSLRAALMEREISERQGGEATLSEEAEIAVVRKQVKQRRDAIEQYRSAGREDLAGREAEELRILEEYLPGQLSDEEIRALVHEVVRGMGGSVTPREAGRVTGETMKRVQGRADGRRVQEIVQSVVAALPPAG